MESRRPPLLQQIRRVTGFCPASDAELLARYLSQRDQDAFADLVTRHGPMVLRVCRRVLGDDADAAEEAWQATFVVLARRAASVVPPEALPAWLHGVASRVALKARSTAVRRGQHAGLPLTHEPADSRPGPVAEVCARELLTVLDEEVARLPEGYRLAVLLCCFEGATQEEAARRLGWTPGSLQGRLERGRKRLHERLARRGFGLGVALASLESSRALAAPVGAACHKAVLAAAASVAAGQSLPVGVISARVVALAEGVLEAMFLTRIKSVLGVLLVTATLLAGPTVLRPRQSAVVARPGDDPPLRANAPPPRKVALPRPLLSWSEGLVIDPRGPMGDQIFCAAFSPDGKLIACGLSHNGKLLDATNGKEKATLDINHPMCLAFSPDGKTLATGHLEGLILWDVATGKASAVLDGKTKNIAQVGFTRDGKHLVSGEVGKVRLWSMATRKEVRQFGASDDNRVVYAAVFSPDGKSLATAEGPPRSLKLWEVSTGKEVRTIKAAHTQFAVAVAWSPDGTLLASSGGEGVVKLWDPATGKELARLKGPITGKGHSLAFSPDGSLLASVGGKENALRLWSVVTRQEVVTLKKHAKQIWSVAFSSDGRRIVTAGDDAVRVWVGEERGAGKK
jgi:RNA polymerase sigma factor (sigma-70 family)